MKSFGNWKSAFLNVALYVSVGAFAYGDQTTAREPLQFNRDVRPILSDHCYACHGPDEHSTEESHPNVDGSRRIGERIARSLFANRIVGERSFRFDLGPAHDPGIWKLFFGYGLSRRLDDLGGQGEPPTHPDLLDHLATEFRDGGWDV